MTNTQLISLTNSIQVDEKGFRKYGMRIIGVGYEENYDVVSINVLLSQVENLCIKSDVEINACLSIVLRDDERILYTSKHTVCWDSNISKKVESISIGSTDYLSFKWKDVKYTDLFLDSYKESISELASCKQGNLLRQRTEVKTENFEKNGLILHSYNIEIKANYDGSWNGEFTYEIENKAEEMFVGNVTYTFYDENNQIVAHMCSYSWGGISKETKIVKELIDLTPEVISRVDSAVISVQK